MRNGRGRAAARAAVGTWLALAACATARPRDERVVDARAAERACEAGDGAACHALGRLYDGHSAVRALLSGGCATAVEWHRRGCGAGVAAACLDAAHDLLTCRALREGPANDTLALGLARTGCLTGSGPACALQGRLLAQGRGAVADPQAAYRAFERGCDLASAESCGELSARLEAGEGVPSDAAGAAALWAHACERWRLGLGCERLAQALEKGVGVEADGAQAAKLRRLACELGRQSACEQAGAGVP